MNGLPQTALCIGVSHPSAPLAERDACRAAALLVRTGWSVETLLGAKATCAEALDRADCAALVWYSGECDPYHMLHLAGGAMPARALSAFDRLTVYDCCWVGRLCDPRRANPVLCASDAHDYNEREGSVFSLAVAACAQAGQLTLMPRSPWAAPETVAYLARWVDEWRRANGGMPMQRVVFGHV